eukprot:CAMPEP_0180699646 /NCGR_PEP_ID=MMETSP1038_2-20121128/4660_1 /TAXON_ID=632150 /ORGANISM="Azadinium spinosum, Strain 3D9" /LENGTH=136 /DNA_ID=CAMNT_0022731279 /DNA_START=41 /DNA_END=448 /DNA_ORIENTATION=-
MAEPGTMDLLGAPRRGAPGATAGVWASDQLIKPSVELPGVGRLKLLLPSAGTAEGAVGSADPILPPALPGTESIVVKQEPIFAEDSEGARALCAQEKACEAVCFHEDTGRTLLYGHLERARRELGRGHRGWQAMLE